MNKDKIENLKNFLVNSPTTNLKYKLEKENRVENYDIFVTPEITKTNNTIKNKYSIKLEEDILNFINTLEENFDKDTLKNLYNNLSTLKVKERSLYFINIVLLMTMGNYIRGYYIIKSNSIRVVKEKSNKLINSLFETTLYQEVNLDLYHELFHMASTICANKKIAFTGFCQTGTNFIGTGLNEGYTEVLVHRYFGYPKENKTYIYEQKIALLLEKIVSKEKMEKLYFKADLYNLIKELANYSSEVEAKQFILDLDLIYKVSNVDDEMKDMVYSRNVRINEFLIATYKNKLQKDVKNEIITLDEYDKKISSFIDETTDTIKPIYSLDFEKVLKKY